MNHRARIAHVATDALRGSGARLVRNAAALIEAATRLVACSGACVSVLAEADGTIVAGE